MSVNNNYKRVVIVDPQLKDCKGHNYRYANGIASELGLDAVILSHQSFSDSDAMAMDVRPVLGFDQYNNSAFKDSYRPGLIEKLGRYRAIIFDRLTARNGIWEQDSPLGLSVGFTAKLISVLLFIPALIHQLYTLLVGRGSSAHTDATAVELIKAFDDINLGAGDLVIFQTMLWPTFESLLEMRIQGVGNYNADAVFIVHEDWLIYNTAYVRFTPAHLKKRVLEAIPFARSKILSTNQPLSDYCEEWSGYRPPVVKEIEFPVENLPEKPAKTDDTINILLPGVYRGDKNFESLGTLVAGIKASVPDAQFCIHETVMARVSPPAQYADSFSVYSDVAGAEAWLAFLRGFDLILLPYGEEYQHRISGIIHEARLLSIPVVCHQTIADAELLSDKGCLYGDSANNVGEAVKNALSVDSGQYFKNTYPPELSTLLQTAESWVEYIDKPVAVQVKPAWTRCGTTVVLDQQLDYLVSRGYFVVEIYIKTEPWVKTPEQVEFMWQVMRGGREYSGGMAIRVLLKDVSLLPLTKYISDLLRKKIPAFFKRENIHSTWCKPDAKLSQFMQKTGVELALVNHVFNNDFARKFIPAKKFIIETHDIQINQLLFRRPELLGNYENELKYELDVLGSYDAIVNLNKNEHKLIQNKVGEKAKFIRPAIVYRKPSKTYTTLAELIEDQSRYPHIKELPEKFDLLLLGDGHPANIESAQRFIDEVYARLPAGTTLGIVGRLAGYLKIDWDDKANIDIHAIGFMNQLYNLYEFTRLLILPDVVGEGIPIKTDEAIASGVPFVATRHALRGFDGDDIERALIEPVETKDDMLSKVEALLADSEKSEALSGHLSILTEKYSFEDYCSHWDKVI